MDASSSLKAFTKDSLRGKKLWKLRFSGYFSKSKTEECDQEKSSLFDKFEIAMAGVETYFLEVSAKGVFAESHHQRFF